jgi:hypothetical protein
MDFRFIAAGILVGTIGFVGGSTVFADTRHPADPAIASLAGERQAANDEAGTIPPAAKLPALPKPPKIPVVPPPPKPRVVVIRLRTRTTNRTVSAPKAAPKQQSEHESEDDGNDHEGGGDD